MNWKNIFNQTLSTKIRVDTRVKHRTSGRLGRVFQTATVNGVPAVSVNHDDGTQSVLVPAEEYFSVTRALAAELGVSI